MRSKKAIKNIISSLLTQVATLICGFITPILIIEKYGSNVNGLMTSITQFLSYISLLDLGFGPVLKSVLYSPLAKKNKNEYKINALAAGAIRIYNEIVELSCEVQ